MKKKFLLYSCSFIYILTAIIFLMPPEISAQVPSPFCLGNCVNSTGNQGVNTGGGNIGKPVLSVSPAKIKSATSQPTVVHAAPCDNTIQHTKNKNKSDVKGNNKKENLGFLQSILKFIEMILQFLQQLLGINLPVTTVAPTSIPGVTINPTVTLPPCPTITPTAGLSITPSPTLFSNPTSIPSSTPTPTVTLIPTVTPNQLTPTPTLITVSPPPVEAINYSGYYFHFTTPAAGDAITTTFKAVEVTCGTGFIAPWPGMGDTWEVEHNLAQLGIDIDCSSGTPRYYAWTEALPAGSIYPPNTPVNQGDTIATSITYQGDGKFITTIANFDRGWSVDTPMIYASTYVPLGAEVINEEIGGQGVMPFSPITFTTYLDIGGKTVQMAEQPGLTRLEATHLKISDLTGSEFVSSYR